MQAIRPALKAAPPSPARTLRTARSTPELRRTFASPTLLSRTDFGRKTVVQLKEELKSRGLSTTGKNKQALLTRLFEDETKRVNASVPPLPLPKSSSIVSSAGRSISTTVRASAKEAALGSRGPNLMPSLLNEGYKAKVWPASITFPQDPEEVDQGPLIPFIPDKFDSHLTSHALHVDPILSHQISTSSDPATLPGGGPAHASAHADDAEPLTAAQTAELRAASARSAGIFHDFIASIGLDKTVVDAAKESRTARKVRATMKGAYDELEQRTGVKVPTMKDLLSKAGAKPSEAEAPEPEPFKFEDRPLNQAEKTGAWGLGLLVAGGWILGGIAKPRKKKQDKPASEVVADSGGFGSAGPST